ncbi:MAG: 2-amino-4-hydroxy-6-hydroxymethyldihydropteridine diphosphokinase [Rhodobacteraceae bacterium]|nr:2-amino-4-hydroxy-6-hydroxymethyldihydropteridine diphosphokinase [Paracoccaceae bacterium]
MHDSDKTCLIALGSNLASSQGGPSDTLIRAIRALAEGGLAVSGVSRFFATPCFPAGAGPDYVNAAVAVRTVLAPGAVLDALHRIEAELGRERQQRWGMRTADLDLIAQGDVVLPDAVVQRHWVDLPLADQAARAPDRLILPHPRVQDRAFVLVPLADIAPDWVHPLTGLSVRAMLERLAPDEIAAVQPRFALEPA